MKSLVDHHADVNITDKNGHSPLYMALKEGDGILFGSIRTKLCSFFSFYGGTGHREIATFLIEKDSAVDFDLGRWKAVIFHCVVQSGNIDLKEYDQS